MMGTIAFFLSLKCCFNTSFMTFTLLLCFICSSVMFKVSFCFVLGTLTNIQNLIVAAFQKLTLSSQTKTATFSSNQYTIKSEPGAYSFSMFTLKDNSEVLLEETGSQLNFNTLELHYGSKLVSKNLDIAASKLILHPGSTLDMTGQGFSTGEGQGPGKVVGIA